MYKRLFCLTVAVLLCMSIDACAKKKGATVYAIGFYNQENLFDTTHDEGKNDFDFLPTGSYEWDNTKYQHKLRNMAKALADMGTDKTSMGCAFIGLAEVENAHCMKDLCAQEPLKKRGMRYIHFEGVDKRGIDVAALYNPALFQVDMKKTKLMPYKSKDGTLFTRGFLVVHGKMLGEHVVCIVCHLPSRRNGDDTGRMEGAKQLCDIKNGILAEDANAKVMIMGDMNDDPTNRSMCDGLRCKENRGDVKAKDMYNPWIKVFKGGKGTLSYKGEWNLFDQILLSPQLLTTKNLRYMDHQIFFRDYLLQQEGKYRGTPKRTHAGGRWLDGFSDHLPVVVYLTK